MSSRNHPATYSPEEPLELVSSPSVPKIVSTQGVILDGLKKTLPIKVEQSHGAFHVRLESREVVVLLKEGDYEELSKIFKSKPFSHLPSSLLCLAATALFMNKNALVALRIIQSVSSIGGVVRSFFLPLSQKLEVAGGLEKDTNKEEMKGDNSDSEVSEGFLFFIKNSLKGEDLDKRALHSIGKFIEYGLNSPQEALGWYIQSTEAGSIEGIVSAARIYIKEGNLKKGTELLESHFELPSPSSGHAYADFEAACREREPIAKSLIHHYLDSNQTSKALRIWLELRARKLLVPEAELLLPQLRLRENSIVQTSQLLNIGGVEPLTSCDILQYSEYVSQRIHQISRMEDQETFPIEDIIASACMLRNADARKYLIRYISNCLREGDAGMDRLLNMVDISVPDAMIEEGERFGIWEWTQLENTESTVPKRKIFLRTRISSIFAALAEDCLFETNREEVIEMINCIERLFPAHVGEKAVFGEENIAIAVVLRDRLKAIEGKRERLNLFSSNIQDYLQIMRAEIDLELGSQARSLEYSIVVEDGDFRISKKYLTWLIAELILGEEYDQVSRILQQVSDSGDFSQFQGDSYQGHLMILFKLLLDKPEILRDSLNIGTFPTSIWHDSELSVSYIRTIERLDSEDFLQEFANFENILLKDFPHGDYSLREIEEVFPNISGENTKYIVGVLQKFLDQGYESSIFRYSNKALLGQNDLPKIDSNVLNPQESFFGNIFQSIPSFISLYRQGSDVSAPISHKQFEQNEDIVWFDVSLPEKEFISLQRYISSFFRLSEIQRMRVSEDIQEIIQNGALYLAYGNANGMTIGEEVFTKLSARRFLLLDDDTFEKIHYLYDYWNLFLLQLEGGVLAFPRENPGILEYLLQLQKDDSCTIGVETMGEKKVLLRELLLSEVRVFAEIAQEESKRGDIISPLFARLSKIFIHWFGDVVSSESFDSYANLYNPEITLFGESPKDQTYVFPVADRLQ